MSELHPDGLGIINKPILMSLGEPVSAMSAYSAALPIENVALGLLFREPKHGYSLYRDFVSGFEPFWQVGQTKFYVTLNKLEASGLLYSIKQPQQGKPARKVYYLTAAGKKQFESWLHQPVESIRAIRVELMAKLRIFDLLHLPGVEAFIDQQLSTLTDLLHQGEVDEEADSFFEALNDYRKRQIHAIMTWLTDYKKRLKDSN